MALIPNTIHHSSGKQMANASIMIILLLLLTLKAAWGFPTDDIVAAAPPPPSSTKDDNNLFNWAIHHGAKIAQEFIEIRSTPHQGRGIYAKRYIPANTELIQIPYHLQLGSRQLADGSDEEIQCMARNLPWRYVMENQLFFLPLGIALVAERRKGEDSLFHVFLESLPPCCNAVSFEYENDDYLRDLMVWAPNVANVIQRRKLGMQHIYNSVAPSSLSMKELQWAVSNVCSRSLIRKRIKELSTDQVENIGVICASDHSRMLPVIDLVNHGSGELANVWVGHSSRRDGDENNDYSTSLKSIRDIEAGAELLFDYGGGGESRIRNDRLLLDYGFVLPEHLEHASISLAEFSAALSEMLGKDRLKDVAAADLERLRSLIKIVVREVSKKQEDTPILFARNGEPTDQTHAIAICMACRDNNDVECLLNIFNQVEEQKHDMSLLPRQVLQQCTEMQREFSRYVLKVAAGFALAQRGNILEGSEGGFAAACKKYSKMCREILQRVADMTN
jgi:hypothetical protein